MKKINEDVQGNLNRDTTQFIKVKKRGQKMTKKKKSLPSDAQSFSGNVLIEL